MGIQINGQTDTISAVDNNFSLAGNVSIGGTLTYEDVTSVDSVGVITARSGIDAASNLLLKTGGSEKLRIDSSGRILVGTDTAPTAGITSSALFVVEGYTGVPTGDALISLQRGQAPASISSGAQLGGINFGASDGSRYAQIHVNSDGDSGTNDYPGRIIFSTTANSSATPTERLRISSDGAITATGNFTTGGSIISEANPEASDTTNGAMLDKTKVIVRNSAGQSVWLGYKNGTSGATSSINVDGDTTIRDLTVRTVTSSDQVISNRSGTSVCIRAQSSGTDNFVVQADGKVKVSDNGRFTCGTDDDLALRHSGTTAVLENNTGSLYIDQLLDDGDVYIRSDNGSGGSATYFQASGGDGQARLFHYGTKKFNTISTGVMVTNNLYLGGSLNGGLSYNSTADTLEFMMTNGGTHSELNAGAYVPSTNAGKDLGQHNKRWDSIYCTGVAFGGNTDGSDHLLDDYEEGTFTPVWQTTGNAFSSISYSLQTGNYTKIGNLCHVSLRLRSTASSGGSGALLIGGLPYTVNDSTGAGGGAPAMYYINVSSGTVVVTCETRDNTNQFYLLASSDAGAWANVQYDGIVGNGVSEIRISFAYQTD